MAPRQRKTNPNTRRSEIVSVRLDPRLKYLAELAARKQRRPLSGFVEWAVERALDQVMLFENPHDNARASVADAEQLQHLWDVDEADRTIRLALNYPELLTYDEQLIWKLVRECGLLWRGTYGKPDGEWQWSVVDKSLIWERLRQHWPTFKKIASGELPASELPEWPQKNPDTKSSQSLDDEIPF